MATTSESFEEGDIMDNFSKEFVEGELAYLEELTGKNKPMTPPTTSNEPSEQAWQAAKEIHFEYSEEWIIECRNKPTASLHKYEALFFEAQEKRMRIALIIDSAFSTKLRDEFNRGKRDAAGNSAELDMLLQFYVENSRVTGLAHYNGVLKSPKAWAEDALNKHKAILASIDEKGEGK